MKLLTMISMPVPSTTGPTKSRSREPAPTVINQGARFDNEEGAGPEFPALQATRMLCLTAFNAPIAMPSLLKAKGWLVPIEMLKT